MRHVCDAPCLDESMCAPQDALDQQANGCVHWAFKNCRLDATYYDYDGLSNQVIAERKSPAWAANPLYPYSSNDPWSPTGEDRFVATYLYGPMGPISRTAEMGDSDVSNNQESYYLRDAMGGNVGLSYDDDNNPGTASKISFNVYDSFGNMVSPGSSSTSGSFAWRGGEGSVTDLESHLVFMQSRHYDPTLGRFLQADSLALAGFTPQGMNRYIYCGNDGVNQSDPTGHFWFLVLGILALGIVGGLLNMAASGWTTKHFVNGFVGTVVGAALAALFLLLPGGPWVVLAALGVGSGSFLTSYLEGDLPLIRVGKGGTACIIGFLLLHGEMAFPWGWIVSILVWQLFNLAWEYFTGGSFSLRYDANDEGNGERFCSTIRADAHAGGGLLVGCEQGLANLANHLHHRTVCYHDTRWHAYS